MAPHGADYVDSKHHIRNKNLKVPGLKLPNPSIRETDCILSIHNILMHQDGSNQFCGTKLLKLRFVA